MRDDAHPVDVELVIRLEAAEGEPVWWAESPQVDGFSVAADTLAELRTRSLDCLEDLAAITGKPLGRVTEHLA